MGFPTSHQPRSCATHNFSKMVFRFLPEISTRKPLQVCYKVSFCLTTSSFGGKVVAQSTTVPVERYQHFGRRWPRFLLPTAVVEYLQITGSVQHIVNLLSTHNTENDRKTQVSEQRTFLWRIVTSHIRRGRRPDAARKPPVGQPCLKYTLRI